MAEFLKIWSHSPSLTYCVCQSQILPCCLFAVLYLLALIRPPHSFFFPPKVTKKGAYVGTQRMRDKRQPSVSQRARICPLGC